ncbi:MAG TPA: glycosyltransferase family A protein [Burkholderiaceae bacterium]|nr:glycosyltransferase family A protein [Burkholderiaceae bacterium]
MSAPAPVISILVAAYNAQDTITDSLQHIVAQMGPQHELIVVDDGSTDATAGHVDRLRQAHPQLRIVLQRQANAGIADARNAALALAGGDYIAFVDSDDRLLPGALDELGRVIAAHRPDAICTAFRLWHPDAPQQDRDIVMHYPPGQPVTGLDAILTPLFDDRQLHLWTKVVRRAIYLQLDQPVFPSGRLFEDMSVVPLLLARCRQLVYTPFVLLAYRQHPASITRVVSANWCVDFVRALASVKPGLAQAGIGPALQARFDAAVCNFYLSALKSSYQLAGAGHAALLARLRQLFLSSLFGQPEQVLAALAAGNADDRHNGRQLRQVLAGSPLLHLRLTLSRRFRAWRARRRAGRTD